MIPDQAPIGLDTLHAHIMIRSPRDACGALHEDYTGLVLSVGTLSFATEAHLFAALGHDADTQAQIAAERAPPGRRAGERIAGTATAHTEEAISRRLWSLKIKTMLHQRSISAALHRRAGRALVFDNEPPWGMRRRAGVWHGPNLLGTLWTEIARALEARRGARIGHVPTPRALLGRVWIGTTDVARVDADGTLHSTEE